MAARKKNGKTTNGNGRHESAVPAAHLRQLHGDIVRIRLVEEKLAELVKRGGRWCGPLFPSTGQEALTAAALIHLGPDDWVSPTHRELGAHLVRGMHLRDVFAHFSSAAQGPMRAHDSGARLGSLHAHTTPSIGSTASNLAVGLGVAMSFLLRKQPHVAVGYFGDAVMNSGTWHEVINMTATTRAPYVMICNNNGYGFATRTSASTRIVTLADRAEAYGVPALSVDGTDVEAVYQAAHTCIAHARSGKGGILLECRTPRLGGFSVDEPMVETIPEDAVDVFDAARAFLGEAAFDGLVLAIHKEIDEAVRHAESLPVATGEGALLHSVHANTIIEGNGRTVPHHHRASARRAPTTSDTPRPQWVFNDFE